MDKLVEIIHTDSNNVKITITPSRTTLKIAKKHFGKYSQDQWESILKMFSEIPVDYSHRGMLVFVPHGFTSTLRTENDKHKVSISFYSEIFKMVYNTQ